MPAYSKGSALNAEGRPEMSELDSQLLAERAMAVERHLGRLVERLPDNASDFRHSTDAADVVILHLWQALGVGGVVQLGVACFTALGARAFPGRWSDPASRGAQAWRSPPR